MYQLKLGYNDIENMPMEYFEWFYDRHLQHLIDLKKEQNGEQEISF